MSKKKFILASILITTLFPTLFFLTGCSPKNIITEVEVEAEERDETNEEAEMMEEKTEEREVEKAEEKSVMEEGGERVSLLVLEEKENTPVVKKELTQADSATYTEYSETLYKNLKGSKPLALFFHASWCPACRSQEKNILADLKSFPEKTTILKVDYDTETALKKEYGIAVQTSFVVLDGNGKAVSTLIAPSLEKLKNAILQSIQP